MIYSMLGLNIFATTICSGAFYLNLKEGNFLGIVVMALCIAFNIVSLIVNIGRLD